MSWKGRIKKHMEFTDKEIGNVRIIKDFLPPPENLILKKDSVKITLSLDSDVVRFFKEQAQLHHTQYQKMIRALLDHYVYAAQIFAAKPKKKHSKSRTRSK